MWLDIVRIAAPLIVGYLVGGIPFSLIVGRRFFDVDLREHGSGNLGATNVFRELGARPALAVAALDVAKGAAAVALGMLLCPFEFGTNAYDVVMIAVAMSAVLGHTYSPYIRFKGGKGVATAAGAILVVMPYTWPILFIVFFGVIALTKTVSLASIVVASLFPVLTLILYGDRPAFIVFSFVAAALVIWRHRANIARLYRGEEPKISIENRGELTRVLLKKKDHGADDGEPASGED